METVFGILVARMRTATNRHREYLFHMRKAREEGEVEHIDEEIFKVLGGSKTDNV